MAEAVTNKAGICPTCNEATCAGCNQCKYCEFHIPGCKYGPKAVGSAKK